MIRITAVWTLSLLVLSGVPLADPQPWMVKENPNDLSVMFSIHTNCPEEDSSIYPEIVMGVLTRSRIKGTTNRSPTGLFLRANVRCGLPSSSNSTFLFSLGVFFGRYTDDGYFTVYYPGYSEFGTTDADTLRISLRERTEYAIIDYLQANFDL